MPCIVNTPSDIIKDRFISENKLSNWGKKNRNDNTNKIIGFFNSDNQADGIACYICTRQISYIGKVYLILNYLFFIRWI